MELLRKRLLPQTLADFCSVFVLAAFIQILYWFEVFLVLPEHYPNDKLFYGLHCIFSTFLLFNVVGNYVFMYLTDTSIQGRMLPSDIQPSWKFCDICESVTPPRSWHCPICKICILKRDHHCTFAACCIGHNNHRYFIMFLLYFSLAGLYCAYFNTIFLWKYTSFSWGGLFKLVFPLAIFIFGTDMSLMQIYRVICMTSIIGTIAVLAISGYHIQNASRGLVMHERANRIRDYECEDVKQNLIHILGERWYLTWVSPLVSSILPHDGIHWENTKLNSSKCK